MRVWALAMIAVVSFCGVSRAQDVASFTRGNSEFAAGHFQEAISAYEEAVRSGLTSANVFYDLANAYYRADDSSHAILNYERALALEPRHAEADANLRLARDHARALELPQTAVDQALHALTTNQIVVAAAIGFWLAMFGAVAWFFRRSGGVGIPLIMFLGIALFVASTAAAWLMENGRKGSGLAIVTGEKIQARLATADNSGTVLALPAGSEIQVLSTRGDWIYAALPNSLRGWLPANAAEFVRK